MPLLLQDMLVTLIAAGAATVLVQRLWRVVRPRGAKTPCDACGACAPAPPAAVSPRAVK